MDGPGAQGGTNVPVPPGAPGGDGQASDVLALPPVYPDPSPAIDSEQESDSGDDEAQPEGADGGDPRDRYRRDSSWLVPAQKIYGADKKVDAMEGGEVAEGLQGVSLPVLKSKIRCLLPVKFPGLNHGQLNRAYKEEYGEFIPVQSVGFESVIELLQTMQEEKLIRKKGIQLLYRRSQASSDAQILIIGGDGREGKVEVFSPSLGSKVYDCLSPGRYRISAAWVPDRSSVLVTGGWNDDDRKSYILLNPSNLANPVAPSQNLPSDMAHLGSATLSGGVLVYGGGSYCKEAYLYAKESWRSVSPMSENRRYFGSACDGHFAYVIGGSIIPFFSKLKTGERYDPNVDRWLPLPELPVGKVSCAAAFHDNRIFLTGGGESPGMYGTHSVFTLDPRESAWHNAPPMCLARKNHCLVNFGGSLFALGGGLGLGYNTSRTVETFDTAANKWRLIERRLQLPCCYSATVAL